MVCYGLGRTSVCNRGSRVWLGLSSWHTLQAWKKVFFFSAHELKKVLRETLTRVGMNSYRQRPNFSLVRFEHAHASYPGLSFRPPGFSPYMGEFRDWTDNQQTQPTYDAGSGNRTQATLVGGECSQHCDVSASLRGCMQYLTRWARKALPNTSLGQTGLIIDNNNLFHL